MENKIEHYLNANGKWSPIKSENRRAQLKKEMRLNRAKPQQKSELDIVIEIYPKVAEFALRSALNGQRYRSYKDNLVMFPEIRKKSSTLIKVNSKTI